MVAGRHIEVDEGGAIHKDAVAPGADEERDVLVGPLAVDAVGIVMPHLQPLAALIEICELLTKAIEVFIWLSGEGVMEGDTPPFHHTKAKR